MVRHLTEKQRIEILILRGRDNMKRTLNEVCAIFNNKYPDNPITKSTVTKMEQKFEELGTVRDRVRGRPVISEDTQLNLLLDLQENPHSSTRVLAANYHISKTSVVKYLKKHRWHPYKLVLVQELNEDDPDRRIQFCEELMNRCNAEPNFIKRVVFSDEATFYLNGTVNRQNCRYWAPTNPHWMMEAHTQFPQKLNVWAGIVGDRIVGPFFIEGSLTGPKYLDLLSNHVVPTLAELFPNNDDPDIPHDSLWYQQDGAPAHYDLLVRNYLNQTFPNRWIGRRGFIEWPARSPDLTPLDFFYGAI